MSPHIPSGLQSDTWQTFVKLSKFNWLVTYTTQAVPTLDCPKNLNHPRRQLVQNISMVVWR